MEEEDEDSVGNMRPLAPLGPQHRSRSKSDTFGFRSKVLQRLRLARSGKKKKKKNNRKGSEGNFTSVFFLLLFL